MSKSTPLAPQPEAKPQHTARPAPLRLKTLFFPRINVEAVVPDGDPEEFFAADLSDAEWDFRYLLNSDGSEATVGMRFKSKEVEDSQKPHLGYKIDIEAFGAFYLESPEKKTPLTEYLRKFAAAAALLGSIREQVAMTTARGPWGILNIPIVSMDLIIGRPPNPQGEGSQEPSAKPAKRVVKKKPPSTKAT